MVTMVRCGHSIREVARKFGVSRPTVQRWVERAKGKRLDRTCFHDLSSAPKRVANRVSIEVERKVLTLRTQLRDESALGEFGAAAIRRELQRLGEENIPSLRTIGYLLERRGALDLSSTNTSSTAAARLVLARFGGKTCRDGRV